MSKKHRKFAPFLKERVKKVVNKYTIQIQGLTDGEHEFEYEVDDKFFEAFEQDLVEKGSFKVNLTLTKSPTMLQLYFIVDGQVDLICDRSLDEFTEEISFEEPYIYKFGAGRKVVAEDMEIIPHGSTEINIAQLIFDFIALAVPIKRLHPRYDEEDNTNNNVYIYSSKAEIEETAEEPEETPINEENIDPHWAALKNLKR